MKLSFEKVCAAYAAEIVQRRAAEGRVSVLEMEKLGTLEAMNTLESLLEALEARVELLEHHAVVPQKVAQPKKAPNPDQLPLPLALEPPAEGETVPSDVPEAVPQADSPKPKRRRRRKKRCYPLRAGYCMLSKRVKEILKERGIEIVELADACRVDRRTMTHYVNRTRACPLQIRNRIARHLKVDPKEITGRKRGPNGK